jgi:hypothetical protein
MKARKLTALTVGFSNNSAKLLKYTRRSVCPVDDVVGMNPASSLYNDNHDENCRKMLIHL